MSFRDIDFEDIPKALKLAGSDRRTIDRGDYVKVLKELGSQRRTVDDNDIVSIISGAPGGGNMFQLLKKTIPVAGTPVATTPLFVPAGGYVFAVGFCEITTAIVADVNTARVQVGCTGALGLIAGTDSTINAGGFPAGRMWCDSDTSDSPNYGAASMFQNAMFINSTTPIIMTRSGAGVITSGEFIVNMLWFPATAGATLVAA